MRRQTGRMLPTRCGVFCGAGQRRHLLGAGGFGFGAAGAEHAAGGRLERARQISGQELDYFMPLGFRVGNGHGAD